MNLAKARIPMEGMAACRLGTEPFVQSGLLKAYQGSGVALKSCLTSLDPGLLLNCPAIVPSESTLWLPHAALIDSGTLAP